MSESKNIHLIASNINTTESPNNTYDVTWSDNACLTISVTKFISNHPKIIKHNKTDDIKIRVENNTNPILSKTFILSPFLHNFCTICAKL